jgi:hypothetical protein
MSSERENKGRAEVFPPLSEGIPEVIWNKKCEYTNGMQLIIKEIQ